MTIRRFSLLFGFPLLLAANCDPVEPKPPEDTGPELVDADGDGYPEGDDCDDTDAAIHPGAAEICDELDNDCDGEIDEEVTGTWYGDADGDGWGDDGAVLTACEPSEGYADQPGDCDDEDAGVHPEADEICNGVDDDCDELTDEDDPDLMDATTWYLDQDGDGYGLDDSAVTSCDQPSGYAQQGGDCDDEDDAFHPGAPEEDCTDPADYNCDGSVGYADDDGDGWAACEECDDGDAAVNPDATELCDGIDNDCDGDTDEDDAADASTWYADDDGDGFGDADSSAPACEQPSGFVADDTDCDDANSAVNPDATELCDGYDNDCDGGIDEDDAADAGTWYADLDGDGFGDAGATTDACDAPSGYTDDDSDCDDSDAAVNPAATELCDGIDNDCDGDTDEDNAADAETWYADDDGDGYGDADEATVACEPPSNGVSDDSDCDDDDAGVNPAATELCDGVDNDCDEVIDENDADDAITWYRDTDGDGYGDPSNTSVACYQPSDTVSNDADCDDGDAAVNPAATELCDGIDNDCDGDTDEDDASDAATWYADGDGDGYGDPDSTHLACAQPSGTVSDDTDCDDGDAAVNPAATEICNGVDDDCDGDSDEDDAADAATWYADSDGDGYGDAAVTTAACSEPSGFLSDDTDCDDTDAGVNPGADESCNGIDDDCDGTIDEDSAIDALTWYVDADGDAYGDSASTTLACEIPSGYTDNDDDCDDDDTGVNPGATELCNGVDDDCDGSTDEDDAADALTWYADADLDGYGDATVTTAACDEPSGWVADDTDCDDGEILVNPGESEQCDGLDNDCDGEVDELVCLDISNVDPGVLELGEAELAISTDATIDTDTGEISGLRGAGTGLIDGIYYQVISQSSGPDLGVFSVTGIDIASAATLWVEGDNALVIASSGDGDIAGVIDAVGEDGSDAYTTSGPNAGGVGVAAGDEGGDGSNNRYSGATDGAGDGAGFVGIAGVHYGNGGGGAGFCYGGGGGMGGSTSTSGSGTATAGGDGAGSSSEYGGSGGDGGDPYGDGGLEPLVAGSGGGGGLSDTDTNPNGGSGGGGAGGGAIQISVDGSLIVSGAIDASGGRGGDAWGGGGGGGSGGAVLLEALELDISGDIAAEGGRGGHGNLSWVPSGSNGGAAGSGTSPGGGGGARESGGGGGGAGWILLRYLDAESSSSATISPATSSACAVVEAM
jgi:hypothetical protein